MGTEASTFLQPQSEEENPQNIVAFNPGTFSGPSNAITTNVPLVVHSNSDTEGLQNGSIPHADGYKWRKYGQKTVKGTNYPRNYYKCTFPECGVKKYVERCEETGIERISYKGGAHSHDASKVTLLNAADQESFKKSVLSETLLETAKTNYEEKIPQTKNSSQTLELSESGSHTQSIDLPSTSPKLVVETTSEVDTLDDGYSWRKYGQKLVKGAKHPRSYYKCTVEDCTVKKQVERRGNSIINTYEGIHNHLATALDSLSSKKKRKLNRTLTSEKLNISCY